MSHPTLKDTLNLVIKCHGETNAVDKGGVSPYYWHLVRVMLRIKDGDEDTLHAALLHDVIEDTHMTIQGLRDLGYNENILNIVYWCSDNMFPDLTFEQWMKKLGAEGPYQSVIVKFSDISDNLGFERIQGLLVATDQPKKKNNHQYPLSDALFKKADKSMKMTGNMGVFHRYYTAWNLILENEENFKYIDHIHTEDFCNFDQFIELAKWLPHEDMIRYLETNKINSWQIDGTLEKTVDKDNREYLSFKVNTEHLDFYQRFLANHVEAEYIANQKRRDNDSFHITFINVMQYGGLRKREVNMEHIESLIGQSFKFFHYGIGTVEQNEKQSWFLILENKRFANIREELGLSVQDFHVTLAFKEKDIHRVVKDRTTAIFDNHDIWEHFVNQEFFPGKKNKISL